MVDPLVDPYEEFWAKAENYGLTPAEQQQADQIARPSHTMEKAALGVAAGFLLYRAYMSRVAKKELKGRPPSTLNLVLSVAWQSFLPALTRTVVPHLLFGYRRGVKEAKSGQVPEEYLVEIAENYALQLGTHLHEVSAEAVLQGYTTQVNRKVPAARALENVLDAYGVPPRAMHSIVSAALSEDPKRLTSIPQDSVRDLRVKYLIANEIQRRATMTGENELWAAKSQAKQIVWMYGVSQGTIPATARRTWVTAHDEKVCAVCGPMHQVSAPVGEQFDVGGTQLWTPPSHVNCRCDVILDFSSVMPIDVNAELDRLMGVTKRFDPHQNRDQQGRWVRTESLHRKAMAKELNANTHRYQEDTNRMLGAFDPDQVQHRNDFLTQYGEEGKKLAKAVDRWVGMAGVAQLRRLEAGTAHGKLQRVYLGHHDDPLKFLADTVDEAPANAPRLYRGARLVPEEMAKVKVGAVLDLPMTSFSHERDGAERFVEGAMRTKKTSVIYELEKGSKALNISPLCTMGINANEYLTRGRFEVVKIDTVTFAKLNILGEGRGGTYEAKRIVLRQKQYRSNSIAKAFGDDPYDRDMKGHFARKEERQGKPKLGAPKLGYKDPRPQDPELTRLFNEARAKYGIVDAHEMTGREAAKLGADKLGADKLGAVTPQGDKKLGADKLGAKKLGAPKLGANQEERIAVAGQDRLTQTRQRLAARTLEAARLGVDRVVHNLPERLQHAVETSRGVWQKLDKPMFALFEPWEFDASGDGTVLTDWDTDMQYQSGGKDAGIEKVIGDYWANIDREILKEVDRSKGGAKVTVNGRKYDIETDDVERLLGETMGVATPHPNAEPIWVNRWVIEGDEMPARGERVRDPEEEIAGYSHSDYYDQDDWGMYDEQDGSQDGLPRRVLFSIPFPPEELARVWKWDGEQTLQQKIEDSKPVLASFSHGFPGQTEIIETKNGEELHNPGKWETVRSRTTDPGQHGMYHVRHMVPIDLND